MTSGRLLQALEMEDAQRVARAAQLWREPEGPVRPCTSGLAKSLAQTLLTRLLQARSAARLSFAARLGLTPRAKAPFSDAVARRLLAENPACTLTLPTAPVYMALPPGEPSLAMLAALAREGHTDMAKALEPCERADAESARRVRACSQCFIVFGLARASKASLSAASTVELASPSSRRRVRPAAALVSGIADAAGSIVFLRRADPVPGWVFAKAHELLDDDVTGSLAVQELRRRGVDDVWQPPLSRSLEVCNVLRDAERDAGDQSCLDGGDLAASKVVPAAKRRRVGGATCAAAHISGPDSGCPLEAQQERAEVAAALAWLQKRSLAESLRLELEAAGVTYEDVLDLGGTPFADSLYAAGGAATRTSVARSAGQAAEPAMGGSASAEPRFSLRALPLIDGVHRSIPEADVAWPPWLQGAVGLAGAATGSCSEAGVKRAEITVTSFGEWDLTLAAPTLVTVLQHAPLAQRLQCGPWRVLDSERVVRACALRRGDSPASCWQELAAIVIARDLLSSIASVPGCVARTATKPEFAQTQTSEAHIACVGLDAADVRVEISLDSLSSLRVDMLGADEARPAAFTLMQRLLVSFAAEPKAVQSRADGEGGRLSIELAMRPVVRALRPLADSFQAFCARQLRSSAGLQNLLDALTGALIGQTALARAMRLSPAAAWGLAHVARMASIDVSPPFRSAVVLEMNGPVDNHESVARLNAAGSANRFCFGLQFCPPCRAVICFDDARCTAGHEAVAGHIAAFEKGLASAVPDHAALVEGALRGKVELFDVPDTARSSDEAMTAHRVCVRQQDLGLVLEGIARHVDGHVGDSVIPLS